MEAESWHSHSWKLYVGWTFWLSFCPWLSQRIRSRFWARCRRVESSSHKRKTPSFKVSRRKVTGHNLSQCVSKLGPWVYPPQSGSFFHGFLYCPCNQLHPEFRTCWWSRTCYQIIQWLTVGDGYIMIFWFGGYWNCLGNVGKRVFRLFPLGRRGLIAIAKRFEASSVDPSLLLMKWSLQIRYSWQLSGFSCCSMRWD